MSRDAHEHAEPVHIEAPDYRHGQKDEGRELVEATFRAARQREAEEKERQRSLVEQVHRDAIEQGLVSPPSLHERPTISYTELPPARTDSPIASEWDFYRREVGRLLAEGHENRWVLIKGQEIVGIWDCCTAEVPDATVSDPADSPSRTDRAHVGEVLGIGCRFLLDGPARQFTLES
jgi:hypothetical protein